MTNKRHYLVWLDWPEDCFRAKASDMRHLEKLVPRSSIIRKARSEKAFLKALPEATHIITWHFKAEWFERAKSLEVLATPAAGRELVAWREAPEGVKVHFGAFHGAIIAESVAAFCLAWSRGFFFDPPETGIWPRSWLGDKCNLLAGTRAVIAGFGRIGKAIGEKLSLLGVKVEGFTRKNVNDLPEAARSADWFIMALPGDTGSDNFLDKKMISKLPRRAVVINIGRGNSIDEAALASALAKKRIRGAYLDVFKSEPTILNPLASAKEWNFGGVSLKSLPNLVPMPHSSAFAPQYIRKAFDELKYEGLL